MWNIIIFVFGLVTLIWGKFKLGGKKEVTGTPARWVGIILMLPLVLAFIFGFCYGFYTGLKNIPVNHTLLGVVELVLVAAGLITAYIVAYMNAYEEGQQPRRRRREDERDDDYEAPRRDAVPSSGPVEMKQPVQPGAVQTMPPAPSSAPVVVQPIEPKPLLLACPHCKKHIQ